MVGIALAETIEIAERAATPGEDRLVVVAYDRDVAVRFGEQPEQLELCIVGVLELIDEDVAETAPQSRGSGRMIAQQLQRQGDLIAEIDDAMPVLDARVSVVGGGKLLV